MSRSDPYTETLAWDELIGRIHGKLTAAYQYTLPGKAPVVKKGAVQPITMDVQKRGGNKRVLYC